MPYIGRTLGQGTRSRFLYTATAGQTTFSGSDSQSNTLAYADNNGLDCFQNGVLLKGGGADYTATTGTSVVLTTGASVNDVIEILVYDVFAIADHVKKSGDAMTGALTNIDVNGTELILDADGDTSITADTDDQIDFKTGGSDRVTIDSSGNLFVGGITAIPSSSVNGFGVLPTGIIVSAVNGDKSAVFNRNSSNGEIVLLQKDGSTVGQIGVASNDIFFGSGDTALKTYNAGDAIHPYNASTLSNRDNAIDLGMYAIRFDDVYASGGVNTASDENEKQDIANLTDKELKVANKLSALFKTYRWKDRVVEKGDKARTHSGIIAQDIQSAFSAEGLDAYKYGLFCSNTWWEKDKEIYDTKEEAPKDATEKTRLSVRYTELFSFIFSSIEARLTALESK